MAVGSSSGDAAAVKPRWYAPTPARFLFAVLLMQGVFFLSAHCRWFWFNERKGYTVLITVAATAMALLLLVAAALVSRLFKSKLQFRLATLLIVVPVMAVPCGWLGQSLDLARRQRLAVATFSTGRNQATYKVRRPDKSWPWHDLLPILEPQLGEDFFTEVSLVWIDRATNDDLEKVSALLELEALTIRDARVTDRGLENLKGLSQLRRLDIQESVSIGVPQITDASMQHLKGLRLIETLRLSGHGITDKGLALLTGLNRLKRLTIISDGATDAGLKNLASFEELKVLELWADRVTDAGLEDLKALAPLRELTLSSTSITELGMESIKAMTQLDKLTLLDTKISTEGVDGLKEKLPGCQIKTSLR